MELFSWQFIAFLSGVLVALAGAAIKIGTQTNQIGINSVRLNKIEDYVDWARQHNSEMSARTSISDRRLDRIESIINHLTISPALKADAPKFNQSP